MSNKKEIGGLPVKDSSKNSAIMYLDLSLINQVNLLANGRYIHLTQNFIAAYKASYQFALDTGTQDDVELFNEAETEMRKFVAKRKLELLNESDYENLTEFN